MKPIVKLDNTGLLSLLVNSGNRGFQHQGITVAGPMDEQAFNCANFLLGNTLCAQSYTLEGIGEITLTTLQDTHIAVTGPNVSVHVNGGEVLAWASLFVAKSSEITIKPNKNGQLGQRYYFAIEGGFGVIDNTLMGIKPLQKGQSLLSKNTSKNTSKQDIEEAWLPSPDYSLTKPLRVIVGYQGNSMSGAVLAQFFNQSYQVSPNSNRMGYRLEGKPLSLPSTSLYSEGLDKGAIQIPPNGQPIVMLADRQTLGGYPKIGAVAAVDIPRLVQALPSEKLHFSPIDVYQARNLMRLQKQKMNRLITESQT